MTKEEFDKKEWCAATTVLYKDKDYYVGAINFDERILGLWDLDSDMENPIDMIWVRCENVILTD